VEIAIISDTHMPRGQRVLPEGCIERLRAAEVIVHAGDFLTLGVLRELQSFGEVVGVHGNVDASDVQAALPAAAMIRADGVTIALVHDAGPTPGRIARMKRRFPDVDAVVFGHSHMPLHQQDTSGFQIFNPGSPTERRRAPHHTMGIARITDGAVTFELVVLG
jgi:putative phosphoesterase